MDIALMPQGAVVEALSEFARRWSDPSDRFRRRAEGIARPFPFGMTRLSLDALLSSLTGDALWALIDSEGVRDAHGPKRVGHIIAGNTPLLAWTSLLRALLMRSTSRVKLPSGDAALWGSLFHEALDAISPALASSIDLQQWEGGVSDRDRAFLSSVDVVLAYGSDRTISALKALCPPATTLLGYGHRVSFALILQDADITAAARGVARDVLLYDQGGCLSPQTVYVVGCPTRTQDFAFSLVDALSETVPEFPLPVRSPLAAMRVREARTLARMEAGTRLWEDDGLRWTVIARAEGAFAPSPTHGVVSVQPLAVLDDLSLALESVIGRLQGCAVAGSGDFGLLSKELGITYVCPPGLLQAPPLSWPQDGIPPLRSLGERLLQEITSPA